MIVYCQRQPFRARNAGRGAKAASRLVAAFGYPSAAFASTIRLAATEHFRNLAAIDTRSLCRKDRRAVWSAAGMPGAAWRRLRRREGRKA
jgi:hypothetical protein